MKVFLLFAFSFLSVVNLSAMEQQQFSDCGCQKRLIFDTSCMLGCIDADRFCKKWHNPDVGQKIVTKEDGCIVGCLVDGLPEEEGTQKQVVAKCNSWLKILINMDERHDIAFSADAVMFLNGKFGRHQYSQIFPKSYGTVEFSLPVAEGCRITVESCPKGELSWAAFALIPMERSIMSSYEEE